ncbi:hypothetical protein PANT_25d00001 [Moesziomyces antarcticus T-34]|uniref:RTA1-domain-containing protein n=1 Tax=Pseudozyma antarctica (strain T-34) TaxID=1151754 RepID=M9M0R7_PSEA3|nr:hypothetical protein PANT_25d00001 [Moesziomyces antarcticus T-34]
MSSANYDQYTVLKYQPSDTGNLIVGIIYAVLAVWFFVAAFVSRAKWTLVLPIGAALSAIGFFCRIPLTRYDMSLGLYIVQQMFVVISPAAFFAFNYSLFGRWIQIIDPQFRGADHSSPRPVELVPKFSGHDDKHTYEPVGESQTSGLMERSRFSFIPPRLVTRIFVCSDVLTFVVQVAAGGIQSTGVQDLVAIGDKLFLAGVAAQGASYMLFSVLVLYALIQLVRSTHGSLSSLSYASKKFVVAIALSSLMIIIRSVYRIIEFAQGNEGYLVSQEKYLFGLDAAPLIIAISVWVIVWPPRIFRQTQ